MTAPARLDRRLMVAPMMDWTDRHCRMFHRLLAPHALLYTEMVVAQAVTRGRRERLLRFDPAEHPVAVQLGGSDPRELAEAAAICEAFGYDEINLNVGCPSDRVQSGRFGACLMAEPALVAECVAAMRARVAVPVTVKTRIGIDDRDSYEELTAFVATVAAAGCDTFIIHARKAWLSGLSPKENREIPPLRYDVAARLKADFPALSISLNGGLRDLDALEAESRRFDGLMVGRAAYETPWFLAEAEQRLFGTPLPSRDGIVERMEPYIAACLAEGVPLKSITRHMLGLYAGQPRARAWRRFLSENAIRRDAGLDVLRDALALVRGAEAADAA
ncbi:MAG TPA: tRNA dihydrouridine(20/20a) synthase DusA [Alphaproteobacteria bacterium]|nr:tRNA dihydrouridine(20/20a) synthase DusA [Alphaproteobacteria bacterium]